MKTKWLHNQLRSCKDFSYLDNGKDKSSNVLIFLSGGYFDGNEVTILEKYLPKDIHIITPSYPGRGETKPMRAFDSINNIAKVLNEWLTTMNLDKRNITIWGHSFGTAVLNEIMLTTDLPINKIIQLTPGEFVQNPFINRPLMGIAKFIKDRPTFRESFRKFIYKIYPLNKTVFEKENSKSLVEQVEGILTYKINTEKIFSQKTLVINCDADNVVDPNSLEKIYTIYPNHTIDKVKHEHIIDVYNDELFMGNLIKSKINPFLDS